MPILQTPRLLLQELVDGDAPFIVKLLNSPGFLAQIGDRGVRTADDARRYLAQGPLASYADHGFGLWKVVLKNTGAAVGMSGLVRRDALPDPDLGYAFLPGHAGRGYASEAGAGVMRHAFEALQLQRVLAIVAPGNAASIRVLGKLGFRYEATRDVGGHLLQVHGATP